MSPIPWVWRNNEGTLRLASEPGPTILVIREGVAPMNDDQAVIAAAPELLAALEGLVQRCMFPAFTETTYNPARGDKNKAALKAALDAIAKAKVNPNPTEAAFPKGRWDR